MVSGSEDRVTGDVLTPVIESNAPRVGACMRTEGGESVQFRFPGKPPTVLLADGAVGSLNLSVMEDEKERLQNMIQNEIKSFGYADFLRFFIGKRVGGRRFN